MPVCVIVSIKDSVIDAIPYNPNWEGDSNLESTNMRKNVAILLSIRNDPISFIPLSGVLR